MKKEVKKQVEKFCKDNGINFVTLPMIVSHYLSIGDQAASTLDAFRVEEIYKHEVAKQEEAEKNGSVCLISPEFQKFLLESCYQLSQLTDEVKRAIIIEALK